MAFTYSAGLAASIAAATTQAAEGEAKCAALNAPRTIEIRWAASGDPWAGATVYKTTATGPALHVDGAISSLGALGTAQVQAACNLSAGQAAVRVTGASGEWMQAPVVLASAVGADRDVFVLPANLTAATGIASGPTAVMPTPTKPGIWAPPGPMLDRDRWQIAIIDCWTAVGVETEVQRGTIDTRVEDWTYADTVLAREVGPVRIAFSSTAFMLGTGATSYPIQFVPLLAVYGAHCSRAGSGQEVVQIAYAYTQPESSSWKYPLDRGYVQGSHETIPRPFKVKVYKPVSQGGALVATLAMLAEPDGTVYAVNDSRINPFHSDTNRRRPREHMAQSGFLYQSERLRIIPQWKHWMPPIIDYDRRDAKQIWSSNAVLPDVLNGSGLDGALHWERMARRSYPRSQWDAANAASMDDTPAAKTVGSQGSNNFLMGREPEPGNPAGHDVYAAPGGVRPMERGYMQAGTYVLLATLGMDAVRDRDGDSILEGCDWWADSYGRRGGIFVANRYWARLPDPGVLAGDYSFARGYYASNPSYKGLDYDTSEWVGRYDPYPRDHLVNYFYSCMSHDSAHAQWSPGFEVWRTGSVVHAIWQSHAMQCVERSWFGALSINAFGSRDWAWNMNALVITWAVAPMRHYLGTSREWVEGRLKREMEAAEANHLAPMRAGGGDRRLANFGWAAEVPLPGTTRNINGFQHGFYLIGGIMRAKQCGLWDIAKHWGNSALEQIATLMDKRVIDDTLDFGARSTRGYDPGGIAVLNADLTLPASWAAANAANPDGQRSFLKNVDGTWASDFGNPMATAFPAWLRIRRDYFPEVPKYPRFDAALAQLESWMAGWRAAGHYSESRKSPVVSIPAAPDYPGPAV